jgi:hypothetical protein
MKTEIDILVRICELENKISQYKKIGYESTWTKYPEQIQIETLKWILE